MYVGKVPELANGFWVGVQLDEPTGTNNGTIHNTQYFSCNDNHGVFIRPKDLTIGEFPPEDDFDMEEDMI